MEALEEMIARADSDADGKVTEDDFYVAGPRTAEDDAMTGTGAPLNIGPAIEYQYVTLWKLNIAIEEW